MERFIERTPTLAGSQTDVNLAFGSSDALATGRKFRTLDLTDGYTREAVEMQMGTSPLSCQTFGSNRVIVSSPVGDLALTHTRDAALS